MAKRAKNEDGGGGGCPDYMLTYGDMMSLLLCFFVMLVSLSKIKEEEVFRAAMDSIKKALGYTSSSTPVDGEYNDTNAMSLIEKIQEEIIRRNRKHREEQGDATAERSQIGKSTTVRNIRDGLKITVGGMSLFEKNSATLLPEAEAELTSVAKLIKGYRNKILIRGHTSRRPLPPDAPFKGKMGLAYARAAAVMEFLKTNDVAGERMNIEACAGNEPVKVHAQGYEGQAPNRRVEIIVKETMVEEYEGDSPEQSAGGQ